MSTPTKERHHIYFDNWRQETDGAARSFKRGHEPSIVLRVCLIGKSPASFPLQVDVDELYRFRIEVARTLSSEEYGYENASARGKYLPNELAKASHDFLKEALHEGDLPNLVALLDQAEKDSVERLETFTLLEKFPTFPWGALHVTEPVAEEPSAKGFLGYRFFLYSMPDNAGDSYIIDFDDDEELDEENSGAAEGTSQLDLLPPAYGLLDDSALRSVRFYIERRSLNALTGAAFQPLAPMTIPSDDTHEDDEPDDLGEEPGFTRKVASYLLGREWTMVHVACHGDLSKANKYLQIRDWQNVKSKDLEHEIETGIDKSTTPLKYNSTKLLFLNICNSSPDKLGSIRSANGFDVLTPAVTIATLGKVCDQYASQLATAFFQRAIPKSGGRQRRLGRAFHAALRERLELTQNPAHLLYAYHGFPEVKL